MVPVSLFQPSETAVIFPQDETELGGFGFAEKGLYHGAVRDSSRFAARNVIGPLPGDGVFRKRPCFNI